MEQNNYGDFEEIKDEKPKPQAQKQNQHQQNGQNNPEFPQRVRLPRQGQLIGIVLQRLGGNRMLIKATDNKVRNCRVPGRFSRKFWIRPNDAVMIEPWPDDDEKGDIVYHYKGNELFQLKKKGFLDKIKGDF